MDDDDTLCYCFHISRRKILNYVRRERPRRASLISECFGAGTGCGWCIPYLVKIHRQVVADEVVEGEDITSEEYEELRLQYLEELREERRERNVMEGQTPRPSPVDDDLDDAFS